MKTFKIVIMLLLAIAVLLPAQAADKIDSKIRFNDFYGEVKIRPNADEDDSYEFVDLDTVIYEDDRIKTEEDSGAILGLEDMSTYVIKPESILIIHTEENNVSKIEMIAGNLWGNVKKLAEGKTLEVEMSQCVAGLSGTTFRASQSPDGLRNKIEVLKGMIQAVLKDGTVIDIPAGYSLDIKPDSNILSKLTENQLDFLTNELENALEKMDEKLDETKLNNKLLNHSSDINDTTSKFESSYKAYQEQLETSYNAKDLNSLLNLSKKMDTLALQASRYKGALKEAEITVAVAKKKVSTAKEPDLLKNNIDNNEKAINLCWEMIQKIETLVVKLENSINELKESSDNEQNEYSKSIETKLDTAFTEINNLVESLSDGSSYSSFKDGIEQCNKIASEFIYVAKDIKENKLTESCKNKYFLLVNTIKKALKDFTSVPEIDGSLIKNLNDIEGSVPNYASDVRKYLAEYKPIDSSSNIEMKKRFVENVTRLLTNYDRMGRVYTKAERMFNKVEKQFKSSSFKTSEYLDCQGYWENIRDAMNKLDEEASELSSCVEQLKSQLESVLGK